MIMSDGKKTLMAHLTPGTSLAYLDDAYGRGGLENDRSIAGLRERP